MNTKKHNLALAALLLLSSPVSVATPSPTRAPLIGNFIEPNCEALEITVWTGDFLLWGSPGPATPTLPYNWGTYLYWVNAFRSYPHSWDRGLHNQSCTPVKCPDNVDCTILCRNRFAAARSRLLGYHVAARVADGATYLDNGGCANLPMRCPNNASCLVICEGLFSLCLFLSIRNR